jgi:hypothetical protein
MAESHIVEDRMVSGRINHHGPKGLLTPFPAANDDYRYLRKRATILCSAFNAQPLNVPDEERAQAWNEYASATPQQSSHSTNHSIVSLD